MRRRTKKNALRKSTLETDTISVASGVVASVIWQARVRGARRSQVLEVTGALPAVSGSRRQ